MVSRMEMCRIMGNITELFQRLDLGSVRSHGRFKAIQGYSLSYWNPVNFLPQFDITFSMHPKY